MKPATKDEWIEIALKAIHSSRKAWTNWEDSVGLTDREIKILENEMENWSTWS